MGGAADIARLHQERKANRLTRRAKRLGAGTRGHTPLITRAPEPSDDRDAAVDSDKDRLEAAHLQQLAELVPGLGLTESWRSGSKSMDGDQDHPSPASTRKIPVSVPKHKVDTKVDTIEDMMNQAQTSLSSKQYEENEGDRYVSHESTDNFAPRCIDRKLRIPAAQGPGPPRPETVRHSKAAKKTNSDTASPKSAVPADDLQDDGSVAPEIIDLSMFDDLDQLLNQLLTDSNARTEVCGATTGDLGIVEDSDEEETPQEATEKHDAFKESDTFSTKVLKDIEEYALKESDTSSAKVLNDTEESDEDETPSRTETNSSITEEPNAFEETDEEESPSETEEPNAFEETDKEESPGKIETLKDNKEDPALATDTDAETGDQTVEDEPVNEALATDTDEWKIDETVAEESVNEALATDTDEETGDDPVEEEPVEEEPVEEEPVEEEPVEEEPVEDEPVEEEPLNENDTSSDTAEDPDIATDMGEEVGYETAEEESVYDNETSSDTAEDQDIIIDTDEEKGYETWEKESFTESETNKEAVEDPDIASNMDEWTIDETVAEESVNEDDGTEESVSEDETEDVDGAEESVNEDETEDPDVAEETDEETDKEDSSIEGASTTEMVLEKAKVVSKVDEEKKPSKIEVKKTETEDPWENLENRPSNIEDKKTEADDPWKNLDEVLQTDEEETLAECDEQDYESDDNDSDDDPESDFSVMAIDFVVDFAGIVETLSEEFSDLMPGKRKSKSKNKFKFQDLVNDTEENAESQRLTDKIAVLAKPSPESKVYVHWDKSDVGKGLITTGNTDHTLHVESDLSSLTATATTSTDPALAGRRLNTSFYFANKSLLSEDNEEEVLKYGAAPQAQKWMCCI